MFGANFIFDGTFDSFTLFFQRQHRNLPRTHPEVARARRRVRQPCVEHPGKEYITFCKQCQVWYAMAVLYYYGTPLLSYITMERPCCLILLWNALAVLYFYGTPLLSYITMERPCCLILLWNALAVLYYYGTPLLSYNTMERPCCLIILWNALAVL